MKKLIALTTLTISLFHGQSASAKSAMFYLNPLGLLANSYEGGLDFKLGQKFSAGPLASYTDYDFGGINMKSTAFGLRTNFFLNGNAIEQGVVLSLAGLYVSKIDFTYGGFTGSSKGSIGAIANIGYQSFLGPIGIRPAIGVAYYSTGGSMTLTDSGGNTSTISVPRSSGAGLSLEILTGVAF